MTYKIDFDHWGRFFNVPCSIVDEHLRLADGNYVKVLLCILSGNSNTADTAELSRLSGVKEAAVNDAVHYWASVGVLRVEGLPAVEKTEAVPASAPVKEPPLQPEPKAEPVRSVRYSPKDLAEKLSQSEELRYVVHEFENIKGTVIKNNELLGLINLLDYYGFAAQSLLLIIEYSHKLGKDSIAYIEKIGKDWFDRGIVDYADVEAEIIRQSKIKSYEYKAVKALGLKGKPSTRQGEVIASWQEKGISIEMLDIAYDKCMDSIGEPKFNYIASIVNSWFDQDIKTPEQVIEKDKQYKPKHYKKNTGNTDTSYDLDEWEKFAMSFDPENGGNNNG
ncbi:MAG: DnaD domain protein [Ruminococcus sp.]|nr:DnaD domain protein [Ruminococcus sp.]MBR6874632.1 DnaD domain protein [Ruminococcus sp.]